MSWFSLIWKIRLVELACKGKTLSFRSLPLYKCRAEELRFPLPCSGAAWAAASAAGCRGGRTDRGRHRRGAGGGWGPPKRRRCPGGTPLGRARTAAAAFRVRDGRVRGVG